MDTYYEQTVACKRSAARDALYIICWAAVAVLLAAALVFAVGVIGNDPAALRINWINVAALAVCLALALLAFRWKDHLRMEYDYLLDNDTLEIYGIYNKRRRRRLASINIAHLKSMGTASSGRVAALKSQRGIKIQPWPGENASHFLYYSENNAACLALVRLDEKLEALIRRQLPVGAWQGEEGK